MVLGISRLIEWEKIKIREIAILVFIGAHVILMTPSFSESDATISCNRLFAITWPLIAWKTDFRWMV